MHQGQPQPIAEKGYKQRSNIDKWPYVARVGVEWHYLEIKTQR